MSESKFPGWVVLLDTMVGEELKRRGVLRKQRWKRITKTGSWPTFVFRLGLSTRASVYRNGNDICIRKQYPTEVDYRTVVPPVYMSDDAAPLAIFTSPIGDVRTAKPEDTHHDGFVEVVKYIADTLLETPDVTALYERYGVPEKKIKLSLHPDYGKCVFFGGFVSSVVQDGNTCSFRVNSQTNIGEQKLVTVKLHDTMDETSTPMHAWDDGCMYYAQGVNGGGDEVKVWLSEEQFAAYYEAV